MPAKAGIQAFKKLNKFKTWIPAPGLKPAGTSFAGMTALFPQCEQSLEAAGLGRGMNYTLEWGGQAQLFNPAGAAPLTEKERGSMSGAANSPLAQADL